MFIYLVLTKWQHHCIWVLNSLQIEVFHLVYIFCGSQRTEDALSKLFFGYAAPSNSRFLANALVETVVGWCV